MRIGIAKTSDYRQSVNSLGRENQMRKTCNDTVKSAGRKGGS